MQTISNATRRTRSPSKSNRSPLRNGGMGMAGARLVSQPPTPSPVPLPVIGRFSTMVRRVFCREAYRQAFFFFQVVLPHSLRSPNASQALHLLGLQPTELLTPPIIRHLAHADLADCVHHVLALRGQNIHLPQLRNDLFRLVSLPCHVKDIPQVGPLQWGRIAGITAARLDADRS